MPRPKHKAGWVKGKTKYQRRLKASALTKRYHAEQGKPRPSWAPGRG